MAFTFFINYKAIFYRYGAKSLRTLKTWSNGTDGVDISFFFSKMALSRLMHNAVNLHNIVVSRLLFSALWFTEDRRSEETLTRLIT